jgi:hypothetical protein
MNIEIIRTIQILIIGTIVYLVNSSLGGFGEAWIAKKAGDSAAEDLGFKTLHPAPHFSFFWYAFMLSGLVFNKSIPFLSGIPGVGNFVPVLPDTITGKYRKAKIWLVFFGRPLVYLLLFLFSFICLFIPLFKYSFMLADLGASSSLLNTLRMIAIIFHRQTIELLSIYCTISFSRAILYFYFPQLNLFSMENMIMMFVLWFGIAAFITPFVIEMLFSLFLYAGILDQNLMVGVRIWQSSIGM